MSKIRVIRIMEYVYDTPERASEDMSRWTQSINVNGLVMSSAVVQPFSTIEVKNEANGDADASGAHGAGSKEGWWQEPS